MRLIKLKFRYVKEVLAIAAIIVGAIALYQTYRPVECLNFECFLEKMEKCKTSNYVNEEIEASWGYRIKGIRNQYCDVEVVLLSAKEGELDLRKHEGESMICSYELGVLTYPNKDLDSCHGILKEGLQKIAIDKLYKYVVNNLGEIQKEFLFR
jgi:hypothetical protein